MENEIEDTPVRVPAKNYLTYYELEIDPFDDRISEGLFYPGAKRQQVLDQLLHLSRYSASLLLVTGPRGSGKTTLKNIYTTSIEHDDTKIATVYSTLLMGCDQLLAEICQALRLPLAFEGNIENELLDTLIDYVRAQSDRSHSVIVIVDDAQDLSDAAMSVLSELCLRCLSRGIDALHLVLFGDSDLAGRIASPLWDDLMLYHVELKNFNISETAEYLNYRLDTAGYNGASPFSFKQIENIYARSRGNPKKVLQAARDVLLATIAPDDVLRRQLPWLHIAAAVILLISFMAYFMLDEEDDISVAKTLVEAEFNPPLVTPATTTVIDTAAVEEELVSPLDVASSNVPVSKSDMLQRLSLAEKQLNSGAITVPAESETKSNIGGDAVTNTGVQSTEATIASQDQQGANTDIDLVGANSNALPDEKSTPVSHLPANDNLVKNDTLVKPTVVDGNKKEKQANTSPNAGEQALMSIDKGDYTLQLLGSHSEARVNTFIKQQTNQSLFYYFRTYFKGKPWFVVTYNHFKNEALARKAIADLPVELKKLNPWVRRVGSIQSDITAYHQR